MKAEDVDPGLQPAKKGNKGGKRALSTLSDKHIKDKIAYALKEAVRHTKFLNRSYEHKEKYSWFPVNWVLNSIDSYVAFLDKAFEELERRRP